MSKPSLAEPFLPALHGSFSLGTLIGAALGIVATAADFSVVTHLMTIGLSGIVILLVCIRFLPPATGRRQKPNTPAYRSERAVWRDSSLWLIGVIVLAMAFAEGTANDWLPLIMVDGHGLNPALSSTFFAVFAAAGALPVLLPLPDPTIGPGHVAPRPVFVLITVSAVVHLRTA